MNVGGEHLHAFAFADDRPDVDEVYMERRKVNAGAAIMGRNRFGPVRGV